MTAVSGLTQVALKTRVCVCVCVCVCVVCVEVQYTTKVYLGVVYMQSLPPPLRLADFRNFRWSFTEMNEPSSFLHPAFSDAE